MLGPPGPEGDPLEAARNGARNGGIPGGMAAPPPPPVIHPPPPSLDFTATSPPGKLERRFFSSSILPTTSTPMIAPDTLSGRTRSRPPLVCILFYFFPSEFCMLYDVTVYYGNSILI